ncbi:MAG TPA: hypothetical protein VHL14_00990, partial [Steroidobacteraceae bacterium]|nr:hypothetical protein [Steroidobacteraceae bacterium]
MSLMDCWSEDFSAVCACGVRRLRGAAMLVPVIDILKSWQTIISSYSSDSYLFKRVATWQTLLPR